MELKKIEAALTGPQLEGAWDECLANWEDATPEEIVDAKNWVAELRDHFLGVARDVYDDEEMLDMLLAVRYIELKCHWTLRNNQINYGLMSRGEADMGVIYRATLVTSLIEALEPFIKFLDYENITAFIAEPIQAGSTKRVTVPVETEKLNVLFTKMEELVMGRILLEGSFAAMEAAITRRSDPASWKTGVEQAFDLLRIGHEEFARTSEAVQNGVMALRFVPFSTLLDRFTLFITLTSERINKQVEMEIFGGEVEIEKQITEALVEPLIHLLRSAITGGIEPEEERQRLGKPKLSMLRLSATYQGNRIIVEVADDGKGFDPDIIGAVAVGCGLLTEERLEAMDETERLQLIFREGFLMTDDNGEEIYGSGMAMVRDRVEQFKGSVRVEATPGKGAQFFISIPLSLAVVNILLVRVGGHRVALPLYAVRESLLVTWDDIQSVKGRPAILLRGTTIPVIPLAHLLGFENDTTLSRNHALPMIVLETSGETAAVVVSDVLQKLEAVLKPLGHLLEDARYVSGGSILSDGRVVPILDPVQILREA